MKVLITGGTGLVGQEISKQLLANKHEVVFLSRNLKPDSSVPQFQWDPEKTFLDKNALFGVDTIINLAGAPVNARWTSDYKNEILKSRISSLNTLYNVLESGNHNVKNLISASAVGFYPDSLTEMYSEESKPGGSFLSTVCEKWEEAALKFENIKVKTSILRIGIVLSPDGGALREMIKPFKLGLGSALGNGKQWMPWIHIEDLGRMFVFALEKDLQGIYNAGGKKAKRNKEFSKILAKVLSKSFFAPNVPKFLLKLIMGESAAIALSSNLVSTEKVRNAGFQYKFEELESTLSDLLN